MKIYFSLPQNPKSVLLVGGSLGQPAYKLWFRNLFQLSGSTTQRDISIMQPAVLRQENTGDQMSHTYLSQPGGALVPPVMGMHRKVTEKWSHLRASHCPATTAHNGSDEWLVSQQYLAQLQTQNMKWKKNACVCVWRGGEGVLQKYSFGTFADVFQNL